MSAKTTHYRLGLFMLAGLAVLVAIVVAVGSGTLWRRQVIMETYFDSSVQGLEVGSAVKYRGVTIGQVNEISFTYARYQRDKPLRERKLYVLVTAAVQPELLGLQETDIGREAIERQVARGLRVRNTLQGVTGLYFLELDYLDPQRNPVLPLEWEPRHLYVPSAPGLVAQVANVADALARRLNQLDIEGLVNNMVALTARADRMLTALPADRFGDDAAQLLAEMRETNRQLQATIDGAQSLLRDPSLKQLPALVAAAARDAAATTARLRRLTESPDLQATLEQSRQLVQRMDRWVGAEQDDVSVTIDNLRQASENLRTLSEDLARNPSQLLRGAPPPPLDRR